MKLLIKQAYIADPHSSHRGNIRDILVENGIISEIAPVIEDSGIDSQIEGQDLQASPGWVDIFSHFAEPGYEFKETLETGAQTAAAGGFTDVFLIPDTRPVTDNKAQVEFFRQRSSSLPVNIWPIGALTQHLEGKQLAEMYDMQNSGAIAFSDGLHPVQSAGVLLKALQYVKTFDGVIIQVPDDASITPNGLMHEGIVSTRLGLPGKAMMAEELIIARDIKLARYTESKIHFTGVTSPKSIEYIRRAKASGLDVTCSVTPYHLFFSDEDLTGYDTNLKVFPPLRPKAIAAALREAVLDGTVDCICSHHLPQEYDSKQLEFEHAKYGMTGLETAYATVQTIFPDLSPERVCELFSGNARGIFNMPRVRLEKQEPASITLFQPHEKWQFTPVQSKSKSKNSAFYDQVFVGKPKGIVRGNQIFIND
ncbi:MAG TPA: dihydroorotase [Puia sp.]|nr:dihydroorotase [Puia sp.]